MISVVTANVYPGFEPIEFMLRNLREQTLQEFEIVIVDAFHTYNAADVSKLSRELALAQVIHVPACEARHVGRRLHWELYNNAALFATNEILVYHGVYRYLHRHTLETAIRYVREGNCVSFYQNTASSILELPNSTNEIEKKYRMSVDSVRWHTFEHTGFFAATKDIVIHKLNGYNEALVNDHWVDCEFSSRARHLNLPTRLIERCLLRLERDGHYGVDTSKSNDAQLSKIGKPICEHADNPNCICYLLQALREVRRIPTPVERFTYDGFEWIRCPKCGTIGIESGESYNMHILLSSSRVRAPINVAGVGRNLTRLSDDMQSLSLNEKVGLVSASHNNPRYLEP